MTDIGAAKRGEAGRKLRADGIIDAPRRIVIRDLSRLRALKA